MTKDTGQEFKTYEFTQNKAPDVVFEGRLVARIDSRDHRRESERNEGRWTELEVYETPAGNWVAVEHGRSDRANETDRTDVTFINRYVRVEGLPAVADDSVMRSEAVKAFGHGWLAKRMAELEGWDVREKYA